MSEQVVDQEVQAAEFQTVQAFVDHLKAVTDETVDTAYVIAKLEETLNQPKKAPRRGVLAGLSLAEMTDEQLKREIINAKSVLYKATQRGASAEKIAENQARVDAAEAEKESRPSMKRVSKKDEAAAEETTDETSTEQTVEADHPVEGEL